MILNGLLSALAVYLLIDGIVGYRNAIGTTWQRLRAAGQGSITILWQRVIMVSVGFVNALVWIADAINEPTLSAAITTYLKPNIVAAIMVGSAVITVWARKRRVTTP